MKYMYENNYNYIDVPEDNDKKDKHSGNVGKTVALVLAVAIIGGASGFGGAYLQDSLVSDSAESSVSVSSTASDETAKPDTAVKPEASSHTGSDSSMVSSLLNTSKEDGTLSTKQIVEKVSPSVVGVHSTFTTQSGTSTGTGTGIILSSEGFIITNALVVQTEVKE